MTTTSTRSLRRTVSCCATRSESGACFSSDRRFRYALWRRWDPRGSSVGFLLLNPSIADESVLDSTLRRCKAYSVSWGHGQMFVANIFPLVSTDRSVLLTTPDRDGEPGRNEAHITDLLYRCDILVLGFGNEPSKPKLRYSVTRLRRLFETLERHGMPAPMALGLNSNGLPKHPLYIAGHVKPTVYRSWPAWSDPSTE
jgi:hypothetical protein